MPSSRSCRTRRSRPPGRWTGGRAAQGVAGRPAHRVQGPRPDQGRAHHFRLPGLRAPRAAGGSRAGGAAARRGRDPDRQDQHAGIRRGQPDLQQGVRRDAQSLRPRQDLRRLVGRRGRGRRLRHAALRRRVRPRREPAQSRQLLQRRRLPPDARPRAGVARPPTRGTRSPCWDRWRAPFPTARCSSARWRARIRARQRRSPSRAETFPRPLQAGFQRKCASPGAAISAGCRWIPA